MGKFNAKFGGGKGGMKKKPYVKRNQLKPADGAVKKGEDKTSTKSLPQKLNPFEIKVNKQKFQVLGRPTKHEKGLPGVSRARALEKRKNTLLLEYKNKFKSNKMIDKRLGEKNPNLSVEGKMEMRFLAEKIKGQNKKSKFLLGDDEILTHRGQTLADIEKFDDPRSDDDEDDEERLGKSFVSDAHFGGGVLKMGDESEETRQNRETLIDNLIAESKKRKEERQKEKEETDDLTDKLDLEFKDVMDAISAIKTPKKSEEPPPKLPDSAYDILVRELRFDPRVKPGDKLKSADEIARAEKEKLEKLEADRLKRMKGEGDTKVVPHRSADDLDDGFSFVPFEPETKTLSFGMDDKEESTSPEPANEEENSKEDEDDEDNEEDEEESDSDGEDSFSDLASSHGDEEQEQLKTKPKSVKEKGDGQTKKNKAGEIPFVFKVPEEYEEFHQLLQSFSDADQRIVLERMIKSNHPALTGTNKAKMEKVFAFLMQYIHDIASSESLSLLNNVVPVVFELTQLVPSSNIASTLLDVLQEKREELSSLGKKRPVSIATLVFLKLTALIFPASDFRHPITTPAFHVLMEALSSPVTNLQIAHMGLGLCTIAYEYVGLSKRYIPEVLHYLHGLVELAIPRPSHVPAHNLVHPFRPVGPESQLLVLTTDDAKSVPSDRLKLIESDFNDGFRATALWVTIRLLTDFLTLWNELPSARDIYEPILESLRRLPMDRYNSQVQESVKNLTTNLEQLATKPRKRLTHEAKKPKPLRLYEPVIEDHFEGRKKRVGSKEKLEREKLQHKIKREMKGAIREIRKDNAFIAREKLKEQIEKDDQRKRKVKELLGSLANQEGDIRKLKKPKKK